MGNTSKTFALLLTIIVAMSCLTLLTVKPANAQSYPSPSTPQFTAKFANSTNPDDNKIIINITNQPFTPYVGDALGNGVNLIYNIRVEINNTGNWFDLYNSIDDYPIASYGSQTTTLTYGKFAGSYSLGAVNLQFPTNSILSFQVKAMIGIVHRQGAGGWIFNGTESGWSDTQTLTIPASSVSPTQTPIASSTPNPSPTVPEFSWLVIVPLLLSVFAVVVIVKHRKAIHE